MKIIVAGDFCPNKRVSELINNNNWKDVLSDLEPLIKSADLSVLNFECPIADENYKPIIKQGPNLKCSKTSIDMIKATGFNLVTLANNHFFDFGEAGVVNTLQKLRSKYIDTVGGGMNLKEASNIYYFEKNGIKTAIINCCEHEFSIATEKTAGANPLNPIKQWYEINEAKKKADYIIMIVHGGHEHYDLPSPRMKELYHFFVDAGANVVINHHQHCFSGYEVYNNSPIFYGLGNLCFDGNRNGGSRIWNEGYIVELDLKVNNINYKIHPYIQCAEEVKVKWMNEVEKQIFNDKINILNSIIINDDDLQHRHKQFCNSKYQEFELSLTPYNKRLFTGLWRRKLLPSFMPANRILSLANKLNCESHRDIFTSLINNKYENL